MRGGTEETPLLQAQRLGIVMQPDPARTEERRGVLNPGAVHGPDGALYLFPRLVDAQGCSRVGLARVCFDAAGDPVGVERLGHALDPHEAYELWPGGEACGCEDARVTYVEPLQRYVMAYVAVGPNGPKPALAVSTNLLAWRRLGAVELAPSDGCDLNRYQNKDATLFPRAVTAPDGRASLALLHRPMYSPDDHPPGIADARHGIWLSYCALDEARSDLRALTTLRQHHLLAAPELGWEEAWIGGGAPPGLTPAGWLVVYHAVQKRPPRGPDDQNPLLYSAGALLLDATDPRRVLYRSPTPILEPRIPEEIEGFGPCAVFPTGVDDRGDGRFDLYYGMADTRIGAARLQLPQAWLRR